MKRISVDIGGTFTDCFFAWDGDYIQAKALTTHHNLSQGFNEALDQACAKLGLERHDVLTQIDSVRYATTLGTNALIERKGPQVGAIVTAGFEATIPLSRGRGYGEGLDELARNDLSSGTRPDPLVPQTLIRPVRERVDYAGRVLLVLDASDVRRQLRELVDAGAQALVVCLTNAVENPAHELRVQEIFLEEYPAHQLGAIPMLLSHQLSGRKGEYVRATSTIVDAFLHATMYHALSELEQNLREHGYTRPMLVNHNSGGMAQLNSTDALQTIHSGPVSGISASEHLARQAGLGNVVATDMGGTSFDIGLVPADGVKHYDFMPVIDRWLVSVPMVHLVTLGAGGGSIASYNRLHQSIQVGPRSAGSDPGPACYDRGGMRPTVTDADLLLGYLDPMRYADGRIPLNRKRAEFAIEEEFGDYLDLAPVEIAKRIKAEVDE
ncbi:MAG TPA: hydantoinase/oxoprolinase family protein, partial [Trebonia sp.]|nr:hydantoinase/oxoprolinase family protein [Trebonia sp.]